MDMKKLLLISILCILGLVYVKAQEEKNALGFTYEEVVTSDLPKTTLWINLKKWISSSFSSYQHVVDLEDKEAGVLIIKWKSNLEYPASTNWSAQYEATWQIDVRENKFRIKIYNASVHVDLNHSKLKTMSIPELNVAQREFSLITEICNTLQDPQNCSLDNRYLELMKKESRYTIVMNAIKENYEDFNLKVLSNLKASMQYKDDF